MQESRVIVAWSNGSVTGNVGRSTALKPRFPVEFYFCSYVYESSSDPFALPRSKQTPVFLKTVNPRFVFE